MANPEANAAAAALRHKQAVTTIASTLAELIVASIERGYDRNPEARAA